MKHYSKIFCLLLLQFFVEKSTAQCTFTIPAVATSPGNPYCGSTVYNTGGKTTIAYYPTHYMWVCPGDTVDFVTDCCINPGNQQTGGAVILEPGAVFILEYGAAGWSVWAKAGSTFINNTTSVNSYNDVIADPGAFVTPGFGGNGCGHNAWCTPACSATCPGLEYDYSLVLPGTGCNVSPVPPVTQFTSDRTTLCAGNTVGFTDQSTGSPTNWKWTFDGGTPSTTTGQNPTVTYDASGTFSVKLVTGNSGGKDSLTKAGYITVNPMAESGTISALRDTVCSGTPAILTAAGSAGNIQWQSSVSGNDFSDIPNAVAAALTDFPSESSFYRVLTTNGNCMDTSSMYKIAVKPSPVAMFSATGSSLTIDFNSAGTSNDVTVFDWDFDDGAHSDLPDPAHLYSSSGTYHVCLTVSNGSNCSFTICQDIQVGLIGTVDISGAPEFKVYPNPFENGIFIASVTAEKAESVEVFDLTGKKVYSCKFQAYLDLSSFSSGMYYLKIKTKEGNRFQKIVRQ